MLYGLIRPLLFKLDAERAHHLTMQLLAQSHKFSRLTKSVLEKYPAPVEVMGIHFPNPLGLAAGLDKNGDFVEPLGDLGFGFIEVGTVTPKGQPGNPQPRLFRVPEAKAIINRMGFNNFGVEHLIEQIADLDYPGVVGVNIGKNKDTPLEDAEADYLHCFQKVYRLASYITINLSSPNTPDLRKLQFGTHLEKLLQRLKYEQQRLTDLYCRYVPLVVKIAPDVSDEELKEMTAQFLKHQIDGVIACNTTVERGAVQGLKHGDEVGGVSGAPLTERSLTLLQTLRGLLGTQMPIISVGGIMTPEDALERLAQGADLIQVYSGLVYYGPGLVKETLQLLAAGANTVQPAMADEAAP